MSMHRQVLTNFLSDFFRRTPTLRLPFLVSQEICPQPSETVVERVSRSHLEQLQVSEFYACCLLLFQCTQLSSNPIVIVTLGATRQRGVVAVICSFLFFRERASGARVSDGFAKVENI